MPVTKLFNDESGQFTAQGQQVWREVRRAIEPFFQDNRYPLREVQAIIELVATYERDEHQYRRAHEVRANRPPVEDAAHQNLVEVREE